jgi:nucleotide-binding universal stress UspA family protein
MSVPFRVVLVPTDFSPCSDGAVALAADLARLHGARLVLLHVSDVGAVDLAATVRPSADGPAVAVGAYVKSTAEAELRATALRAGLGDVGLRVEIGRPAERIVAAAAAVDADVVVMGTHGRTGLAHLLVGSVTERVVRTCSVPVLTVRPRCVPDDVDRRTAAEQLLEDESTG